MRKRGEEKRGSGATLLQTLLPFATSAERVAKKFKTTGGGLRSVPQFHCPVYPLGGGEG